MQVLIFIGLIILGGILGLTIKPEEKTVNKLAIGYIDLILLTTIVSWVFYFAGLKNAIVLKILSYVMSWGGGLGYMVLGYLIGHILFLLTNSTDKKGQLGRIICLTLVAISIQAGTNFILATVGKLMYVNQMLDFFKQSGYAPWFLYFIMIAEPLGGLGLLLHFKLKTGPLAAACLMFLMLGAVYTHWHNHDPFSDSYAAVIQFIMLSLMHILYYSEKKATSKSKETPIYIV